MNIAQKLEYRDGLLNDVVPFWLKHGVDPVHGGIITTLDCDGTQLDTDKSVWAQGRSAWLLAELYNEPGFSSDPNREHWLESAINIASFIEHHCFDPNDGRLWFHVTRDGTPIRKRRYSYGESFAAIAFGELYQATGTSRFRELAESCFQQFVNHSKNPNNNTTPKFTNTRPSKSIGFPMIALVTAQELRGSIELENADELCDQFIHEIESDFWKPELACVMETVAPDGKVIEHQDGQTLNPGHAIEGAWFIMQEGRHRNDPSKIELGLKMLTAMWDRGWDSEFGGLLYFVGLHGKPVQEYWHDMKFWWNHNELLIATLMASHLSDDRQFQSMYQQAHDWTYRHFPDPTHGEWFGYLRRDGRVSNRSKGNLWKSLFHVPRMQLQCWRILDEFLEK